MKRTILTALTATLLCGSAGAQQIQGDFDAQWGKCVPWDSKGNTTNKGTQPQGWTISNVTAMNEVGAAVTGKNGTGYAVQLTNQSLMGQTAPAYITLGTTWATAETNFTSVRNADGGSFGGKSFDYRPDAISLDYKRDNSHGTSEPATVVAYLWKGTYTQKDVPGNTALGAFFWGSATKVDMTDRDHNVLGRSTALGGTVSHTDGAALIASLESKITSAASNWTHLEVPFNYEQGMESAVPEKVNVILAATDYFGDRGNIKASNSFTVDNVEFVYYHALSDLKYDGQTVAGFEEGTTSYDLSKVTYDESKVSYTKKGVGATVEQNYDASTCVLTITVKGNDYSVNNESVTTYTVQFAKAADKATTYTNDLLIDLRDINDTPMGKVLQKNTPIQLIETPQGSYSFLLENFSFQGITIDDIRVDNLKQTTQADGPISYTGKGEVQVLNMPVNVRVDATVQGDNMTATIEIPGAMDAFNITVTFAPSFELSGDASVNVANLPEGRSIAVLKRHFYKGWNTLCLPISLNATDLGTDVKAQAFTSSSADGSELNFSEVTSLEAGLPYLVWFNNETDLSQEENAKYFVVDAVSHDDPAAVTFGNWTFQGNYEASFSMNGRYGVADYDGVQKLRLGGPNATLPATGAWFKSLSDNVTSATLNFDTHTTGIGSVEQSLQPADSAVYNLQGVKVSNGSTQNLPAGIYLQGGRKILVR